MAPVISTSRSRKGNGYVKAMLALEITVPAAARRPHGHERCGRSARIATTGSCAPPSAVGARPAARERAERAVPAEKPATLAWGSSTPGATRSPWAQDQPIDPSVTHRVRGGPAGVPAAEARPRRRAIEREGTLLAVAVLEVANVEVGGLGAHGRRGPACHGFPVVNRQHQF